MVRLKLGSLLLILKFHVMQHNIVGVRSDCGQNKHVFFLDMDHVNIAYAYHNLKRIQKKYHMSDIYIIRSSEYNFHCIELTPRSFEHTMTIQNDFDPVMTKKYQLFSVARGYWVLRCSPKKNEPLPELLTMIPGDPSVKICASHRQFMELQYGITVHSQRVCSHVHDVAYDRYSTVRHRTRW